MQYAPYALLSGYLGFIAGDINKGVLLIQLLIGGLIMLFAEKTFRKLGREEEAALYSSDDRDS